MGRAEVRASLISNRLLFPQREKVKGAFAFFEDRIIKVEFKPVKIIRSPIMDIQWTKSLQFKISGGHSFKISRKFKKEVSSPVGGYPLVANYPATPSKLTLSKKASLAAKFWFRYNSWACQRVSSDSFWATRADWRLSCSWEICTSFWPISLMH